MITMLNEEGLTFKEIEEKYLEWYVNGGNLSLETSWKSMMNF